MTSQLLVPFVANIIRRDEKRRQVIKRFNLCFAMSADASPNLGASPVSSVRASESTNVMVVEDSRDHVYFPVRTHAQPTRNLKGPSRALPMHGQNAGKGLIDWIDTGTPADLSLSGGLRRHRDRDLHWPGHGTAAGVATGSLSDVPRCWSLYWRELTAGSSCRGGRTL